MKLSFTFLMALVLLMMESTCGQPTEQAPGQSLASTERGGLPVEITKRWSQKMKELARTFSDLLPELVRQDPATPAQAKSIEQGAKKLLELSHELKAGAMTANQGPPNDADPTIGLVSNIFEREVRTAYRAIQYGQVEYAKRTLRSISSYCIACHTRHDRGPSFPTFSVSPKTKSLSAMEKAELFAATRHFDAALEGFEKIASDATYAHTRQIEWGRAVRQAFTISIRVKHDPERTSRIVESVMALPELPALFKEMVPAWKQAIDSWRKEGKREPASEEEWYQEALRLYDAAHGVQKYGHDRSGDILYLRFSFAVHELLARYPNSRHSGEALLLAGTAYQLLDDWLASPLPNLYFEACVRKVPHSQVAHQCFVRLEDDLYFGYTGSSGTHIPDEVQRNLKELEKLAEP